MGTAVDGSRSSVRARGLTLARSRQATQLRVWFCAKGIRAHAELAALARARHDDAVRRGDRGPGG